MKDLRKYLVDVLDAIAGIEVIAKELKISDMNNIATRWALERGISIIGEALYQADKIQKNLPITNLERIKGTRHIVVHDYDLVDKAQIFSMVQIHLPVLKIEVENILNSLQ